MLEKKTKQFEPAPALAFACCPPLLLSQESVEESQRQARKRGGSALIMTIVLTSLLAIVAVMFVAVARMDRASTSNIADNKTLDLAAKSIVEIISKELILDTPGVAKGAVYPKATYPQYYDYQDYPDANDAWLASIEPYWQNPPDPNTYKWRQISDITGYLAGKGFTVRDVNVDPEYPLGPGSQDVIREYPTISLDASGNLEEQSADADGDGIADSKWIELKGVAGSNWSMRSSKGQRIYAAVRVIDNGGMVNINTAHSFNVIDANKSDGTSQMQINLKGLLKGTDTIAELHEVRCGSGPNTWPNYEKNVIWNYNSVPDGNCLSFDISDELELRYRYCINSKFKSRFEYELPNTIKTYGLPGSLYDGRSNWGLSDWQVRIPEPNWVDRRHMLTTYNLDRVIDPNGDKMTNINYADVNSLYTAVRRGLIDANGSFPDVNEISAQIAVNIIDYRDIDPNVKVFKVDDVNYYGFEQPCVYISELAYRQVVDGNTSTTYKSYAIELYKPYTDDIGPNSTWQVRISNPSATVSIDYWTGLKQYYVIKWETSPQAVFDVNTTDANTQDEPFADALAADSTISLTRKVNGVDIVVDSVVVPPGLIADGNHSTQRDIRRGKCIMRLWGPVDSNSTLGKVNTYISTDANTLQAHPKNGDFTNIGEIGMVFRKPAYYKPGDPYTNVIGYDDPNKLESAVRLNIAEPDYQQIFKYLTVMDPRNIRPTDPNYINETRIKGRININTAPAYVIAQLPWVAHRKNYDSNDLAKAIVAYRDKSGSDPNCNYSGRTGDIGFENIGQLCNVIKGTDPNFGIDYYKRDSINQIGFPDIDKPTERDAVTDDFEERDLIFARISDLVTVRSDVFTAYILVRVCTSVNEDNEVQGPQKRYMVIFDRSQTTSSNKRVKIIAFQSVPEAR